MKRVAVPFIEPKGLLVTTIGVGLTAALLQSVSIRTFIHLWPKPPVPIALTVFIVSMILYVAWTILLSTTIERLSRLLILLMVCMAAAGVIFGWTMPLFGDDGATSLRDRDQLIVAIIGPVVIAGTGWAVMVVLVLITRWILGKPRPWTPDACPKCLYELGADHLACCPECGTEPIESAVELQWPARWVCKLRNMRWILVVLPLAICVVWTGQQVVTRTQPILRFEAVMPGEMVNLHHSYTLEPQEAWQRDLGRRVSAKLDRNFDQRRLASILYTKNRQLVLRLYLQGQGEQDPLKPRRSRPSSQWACAEFTPAQTRHVLREGALPPSLIETMQYMVAGQEEPGDSTQWFDPSPFFPPE